MGAIHIQSQVSWISGFYKIATYFDVSWKNAIRFAIQYYGKRVTDKDGQCDSIMFTYTHPQYIHLASIPRPSLPLCQICAIYIFSLRHVGWKCYLNHGLHTSEQSRCNFYAFYDVNTKFMHFPHSASAPKSFSRSRLVNYTRFISCYCYC